jgi:nucleotide-binding universal stress UspA family protein
VRIVRSGFPERTGSVHLIFGTDGSPQAQAAAHEIATRPWPPETEVVVVAALSPENSCDEDALASADVFRKAETGKKRLQTAAEQSAEQLNRAGLKASVIVPEGDPATPSDRGRDRHADAIFVGGRGLSRLATLFLGSVSSRVVRHAHCTVEIVRGK